MTWVKVIPSARTLSTIFLLSSDLNQETDSREQLLQFSRLEITTSLLHTYISLPFQFQKGATWLGNSPFNTGISD